MLTPSIGFCSMPFTSAGGGGPTDCRVRGGAAPVRGHLLRPLIGGVHRVRPADCVMVVGRGSPELVDPGRHELRGLEGVGAVEDDVLVERTVDRPLGAGSVVADDVV